MMAAHRVRGTAKMCSAAFCPEGFGIPICALIRCAGFDDLISTSLFASALPPFGTVVASAFEGGRPTRGSPLIKLN